jgi:hypothetical protein
MVSNLSLQYLTQKGDSTVDVNARKESGGDDDCGVVVVVVVDVEVGVGVLVLLIVPTPPTPPSAVSVVVAGLDDDMITCYCRVNTTELLV